MKDQWQATRKESGLNAEDFYIKAVQRANKSIKRDENFKFTHHAFGDHVVIPGFVPEKIETITVNAIDGGPDLKIDLKKPCYQIVLRLYEVVSNGSDWEHIDTGHIFPILFKARSSVKERWRADVLHMTWALEDFINKNAKMPNARIVLDSLASLHKIPAPLAGSRYTPGTVNEILIEEAKKYMANVLFIRNHGDQNLIELVRLAATRPYPKKGSKTFEEIKDYMCLYSLSIHQDFDTPAYRKMLEMFSNVLYKRAILK